MVEYSTRFKPAPYSDDRNEDVSPMLQNEFSSREGMNSRQYDHHFSPSCSVCISLHYRLAIRSIVIPRDAVGLYTGSLCGNENKLLIVRERLICVDRRQVDYFLAQRFIEVSDGIEG